MVRLRKTYSSTLILPVRVGTSFNELNWFNTVLPSLDQEQTERFSRKVFVGGLPPDIDEGNKVKRLIQISF